jgi:hypothetical protein
MLALRDGQLRRAESLAAKDAVLAEAAALKKVLKAAAPRNPPTSSSSTASSPSGGAAVTFGISVRSPSNAETHLRRSSKLVTSSMHRRASTLDNAKKNPLLGQHPRAASVLANKAGSNKQQTKAALPKVAVQMTVDAPERAERPEAKRDAAKLSAYVDRRTSHALAIQMGSAGPRAPRRGSRLQRSPLSSAATSPSASPASIFKSITEDDDDDDDAVTPLKGLRKLSVLVPAHKTPNSSSKSKGGANGASALVGGGSPKSSGLLASVGEDADDDDAAASFLSSSPPLSTKSGNGGVGGGASGRKFSVMLLPIDAVNGNSGGTTPSPRRASRLDAANSKGTLTPKLAPGRRLSRSPSAASNVGGVMKRVPSAMAFEQHLKLDSSSVRSVMKHQMDKRLTRSPSVMVKNSSMSRPSTSLSKSSSPSSSLSSSSSSSSSPASSVMQLLVTKEAKKASQGYYCATGKLCSVEGCDHRRITGVSYCSDHQHADDVGDTKHFKFKRSPSVLLKLIDAQKGSSSSKMTSGMGRGMRAMQIQEELLTPAQRRLKQRAEARGGGGGSRGASALTVPGSENGDIYGNRSFTEDGGLAPPSNKLGGGASNTLSPRQTQGSIYDVTDAPLSNFVAKETVHAARARMSVTSRSQASASTIHRSPSIDDSNSFKTSVARPDAANRHKQVYNTLAAPIKINPPLAAFNPAKDDGGDVGGDVAKDERWLARVRKEGGKSPEACVRALLTFFAYLTMTTQKLKTLPVPSHTEAAAAAPFSNLAAHDHGDGDDDAFGYVSDDDGDNNGTNNGKGKGKGKGDSMRNKTHASRAGGHTDAVAAIKRGR